MATYRADASPVLAAAFLRRAWTPGPDAIEAASRLYAQDRPAFTAQLNDAWSRDDLLGVLSAAQVLERNDDLSPKNGLRLWTSLIATQDWAHALSLLEDPRFAQPGSVKFWLSLAQARAAIRTLESARDAVAEAVALDGSFTPGLQLRDRIDRALELVRLADGFSSWAEFAELIDALTALHRYPHAVAALKLFVRRAQTVSKPEARAALACACTLFGAIEPEWALDLLLQLRPLFERLKLHRSFAWTCERFSDAQVPPLPETPELAAAPTAQACLAQALAAGGRLEAACQAFGPLASASQAPLDCRVELSQVVGRLAASAWPPRLLPARSRRKIIDVFPIYDELLMLSLKLEEMAPWVDHFVILEASTTFSGRPKPLVFQQNRAAFASYADKIIHQVVEFPPWADSPWAREFYQRDAALKSLSGLCAPDDLVLVTDVDEIVRRDAIEQFHGRYGALGMDLYRYFFNLQRTHEAQRTYASVMKAKHLGKIGLSASRSVLRKYDKACTIWDAGWHFSSVMTPDDLINKFNSYSHTEHAGADKTHYGELLARIRADNGFAGFERLDIDSRFPAALRNNLQRISQFVL